jgi:hypothetical protein
MKEMMAHIGICIGIGLIILSMGGCRLLMRCGDAKLYEAKINATKAGVVIK